jgi:hypothetical protein
VPPARAPKRVLESGQNLDQNSGQNPDRKPDFCIPVSFDLFSGLGFLWLGFVGRARVGFFATLLFGARPFVETVFAWTALRFFLLEFFGAVSFDPCKKSQKIEKRLKYQNTQDIQKIQKIQTRPKYRGWSKV